MTTEPRIVTLCGSTRFAAQFHEVNRELTLAGWIVLAPGSYSHSDGFEITDEQKAMLDVLHLRKIDMSDGVVVVDVGGYVGESTRREIEYAERVGKPVSYWSAGRNGPGKGLSFNVQPSAVSTEGSGHPHPSAGPWTGPRPTLTASADRPHDMNCHADERAHWTDCECWCHDAREGDTDANH